MFLRKLNISKLTPDKLPWYPENPDRATWPRITGTEDPVERFHWDESWEYEENYQTIRTIIAFMKRHGDNLVPSAISVLREISEEDFEKRVVRKFTSLQKGLREIGILDAKNKRVVVAAETSDGEGDDPVVVPVATKSEAVQRKQVSSTITSRANGVSFQLPFSHSQS